MEHEPPSEDKSKFNAAIATLKRIDEAKRVLMDCKLRNNYVDWYKCLGLIRSAINGKMKQDERTKADTFEELIEDTMSPKRDYSVASPFFSRPRGPSIDYNQLKYLLNHYEYYLVDIEEKKGMGLIDDDEDEGL